MKEERLKIKSIKKTTAKLFWAILKATTTLVSTSLFFGGVYSIVEGVKGRAILADNIYFNYIVGLISVFASFLSMDTTLDIDDMIREVDGEVIDTEEDFDSKTK